MDQEIHPATLTLEHVKESCLCCRRIDSWQKLQVLLWLYEHRDLRLTCEELAERLYLGDTGMVKTMLDELRAAGFVVAEEGRCVLVDSPEILSCVAYLHRSFADPLIRQSLIKRLREVHGPGMND
jgi:hypothetical protein